MNKTGSTKDAANNGGAPTGVRSEANARYWITGAFAAFSLFTVILMIIKGDYYLVPSALVGMMLSFAPLVIERLIGGRLNTVMYTVCMFYSIGPMLGDCYKLYYVVNWFDKTLHFLGGVIFALLGCFLFEKMSDSARMRSMAAVFAVCFSITVACVWEFYEYGMDSLLGIDMQHDTVVTEINSYNLGNEPGVRGEIREIDTVSVNGAELETGYLDIGLHDTMKDMLLESVGALGVMAYVIVDRERHPLITDVI